MTEVKEKKNTQYFTQDTEDAIVLYNSLLDQTERDILYRTRIHYAFFKLTENIIHTFKFYYTEVDNIEDLQHEVITFLLTKLHLFNPDKGAKAYSYFGTIAKRYLINSNNKNYKKRVEKAPVSEIESNESFSYRIDEGSESDKLIHFIDQYVEYCTENIDTLFPKKVDSQIADAILELFRKRESIDVFNKKALYIYIREITDTSTPQITKITKKLDTLRTKLYNDYYQHGYIKI
jgi:DNA-directed RNA polymerase specialized sigma24 family protein